MKLKHIKSTLILGAALLLSLNSAVKAEPIGNLMSYQGKLTTATGIAVTNGSYSVVFKIYENGTVVLTQTSSVATLSGVFSTFLNTSALAFDPAKQYQLGVNLNGVETKQDIASVPVAQVAKSVAADAGGITPVGGVIMWWSNGSVPVGWAICDGSVVNSTGSPLLGKALPDLRDKFVRGVSNSDLRTSPVSGGSDVDNHTHLTGDHVLTIAEMPNHKHPAPEVTNINGFTGIDGRESGDGGGGGTHWTGNYTGATGGDQPHNHGPTGPPSNVNTLNNVPAYVGLVYIIRIY